MGINPITEKIDKNNKYHTPVLLEEVIEALQINPDGVYVDATYGGGGHSKAILNRMTAKGRLFGIDQDEDTGRNRLDDERLTVVRSNFKFISHFLDYYGIEQVDGILADLGVSSHQFDQADRGFSYRNDAILDMRMNRQSELTASVVLNTYSAKSLQEIFSSYGEVRNAKMLSRLIVQHQQKNRDWTVSAFNDLINTVIRGDKMRYLAQVYQALRIEVNDEINSLKDLLQCSQQLLKPGGRIAVISFHSIEDRMVKYFFRTGNFTGERVTDDFGRLKRLLEPVSSKPIVPGREELLRNSRAASAKLRVAQKVKTGF